MTTRFTFAVLALALCVVSVFPGPAQAGNPAVHVNDLPWINVRDHGATGDGVTDVAPLTERVAEQQQTLKSLQAELDELKRALTTR
jgi:hypothetical protein